MRRFFLTPEQDRLRAGFRLLGQLLLLGVFFLLISGCLLLLLPITQVSTSAPWLLLSQVGSVLAVTASVYLARRWLDRRTFSSLGLRWNWVALQDMAVGFLISGALIGVIYLLEWGGGWLTFRGFAWQDDSLAGGTAGLAAGVLTMLLFFLVGSWQEELLDRGYWLQNIEEGLNLFWGVLISSVFFSLTHLANPNISPMAVLGLVAGGFFLAYGYIRTRQLWLPIGLHTGWNFFESTVFGFPVSGMGGLPRLIQQDVSGPELLTGGEFGPEAGLLLLPGLLLGILLVYLYTRSRTPHAAHRT